MANVTIPNLTSATTIAPSTDLMVLEQTNGTRKATLSQIFTSSATSGSGLGITSGGVYTIKSGLDSDISDINTLLGNTSIASIGDGTVTGAVSKINSDLSDKQDKPTTGVITLSSTDCVPTVVGTSVYYQNDLLVNAKKVCVFCESLSSDFSATIDTLNGSVDYNSAIIDTTTPQSEGTSANNNFWKAKLLIAFRRSWGGIYLNVQFMGSSQNFSNLRVTKIYYEK